MYAKVYGASIQGIEGQLITVEIDIAQGMPTFEIVGLPAASVKEARERVRAALKNTGYEFPMRRIIVNLAPADLRKDGAALDLAIAIGIIVATGQMKLPKKEKEKFCSSTVFIGELSLEGDIRPVTGVLAMTLGVLSDTIQTVYTSIDNAKEASYIGGSCAVGAGTLKEIMSIIEKRQDVAPRLITEIDSAMDTLQMKDMGCDFSDVRGQFLAKRGLEIAAAGFHNSMMIGPPGSGKTMLAERLMTILPRMTKEEVLEVSKIYSIAGLLPSGDLQLHRPFRKPHHTVTLKGMAGGGIPPKPGEITLAHKGILFLDEAAEFKREILEVLRQPIETRVIQVSRAGICYEYPADFLLIISMNPCPCGFYGDHEHPCICKRNDIKRYRNKLSGPLLDRIDISMDVQRPKYEDLLSTKDNSESSQDIVKRVQLARNRQYERFLTTSYYFNSHMTHRDIEYFCSLSKEAQTILEEYFRTYHISARAYDKIIKVAQTIADLSDSDVIDVEHIAESITYRSSWEGIQ